MKTTFLSAVVTRGEHMKRNWNTALNRTLIAVIAAVVAFAGRTAAAQAITVVGTGDPDLDVPAVQAAVDRGGQVSLRGHFSFDRPPTRVSGRGALVTVLISKAVAIFGTRDQSGEMTSIEGGTIPFEIEAWGTPVTIQGLRFVGSKGTAIWVYAVSGLVIASCRIEGVDPLAGGSAGLTINTSGLPPSPAQPGKPDNVSGPLLIVNNDIDLTGGTANDNTSGVLIFSVGTSEAEVEIYVSRNNVRNTTERAVNVYQVGGRAYIVGNVITTSATSGTAGGVAPDVIHVVGSGSYLIAHNRLESRWAKGAGIRVHSQFVEWPIARAIVVDNDVIMSAPEETVFGTNSVGIDIRGSAQGTVVLNNRIRGRARVGLGAFVQDIGTPKNNSFVLNDLKCFESSLADVFVDAGVTNTLVVGRQRSIEDHGAGTTIVQVPLEPNRDSAAIVGRGLQPFTPTLPNRISEDNRETTCWRNNGIAPTQP
jgi:hypothetical protein